MRNPEKIPHYLFYYYCFRRERMSRRRSPLPDPDKGEPPSQKEGRRMTPLSNRNRVGQTDIILSCLSFHNHLHNLVACLDNIYTARKCNFGL